MSITRTEATFAEKYRDLDDQTLRDIARGHAPWREHEQYVHAARVAARRVLRERGASGIPWVPLWDVRAPSLPGWVRWTTVGFLISLAAGSWGAWMTTFPDRAVDDDACALLERTLEETPWAKRIHLDIRDCRVDRIQTSTADGVEKLAMHARACVQVDRATIERFQRSSNRWECMKVQRMLPATTSFSCRSGVPIASQISTSSRLCQKTERPMADLMEQPRRQWWVQVRD